MIIIFQRKIRAKIALSETVTGAFEIDYSNTEQNNFPSQRYVTQNPSKYKTQLTLRTIRTELTPDRSNRGILIPSLSLAIPKKPTSLWTNC